MYFFIVPSCKKSYSSFIYQSLLLSHCFLFVFSSHSPFIEADVNTFCQDELGQANLECVYDYRSTANEKIAENTRRQKPWWENVYEGMKPGLYCTFIFHLCHSCYLLMQYAIKALFCCHFSVNPIQ